MMIDALLIIHCNWFEWLRMRRLEVMQVIVAVL
jgi:hypothetical protein